MLEFSEINVETSNGIYHVSILDEPSDNVKPVMVTIHNIGENFYSNFEGLLQNDKFVEIVRTFTMININLLGQEPGALTLPSDQSYPSYIDIASNLNEIFSFFNVREFVGFGIGAGANILLRYAIANQERVRCLVMINPCINHQTSQFFYMEPGDLSSRLAKLIRKSVLQWNRIRMKRTFNLQENELNKKNVNALLLSHLTRLPIEISHQESISIRVLVLSGSRFYASDDAEDLRQRWKFGNAQVLKFDKSTDPLTTNKEECVESILFFLQGLGYCMRVRWSSSSHQNDKAFNNNIFNPGSTELPLVHDIAEAFPSS